MIIIRETISEKILFDDNCKHVVSLNFDNFGGQHWR